MAFLLSATMLYRQAWRGQIQAARLSAIQPPYSGQLYGVPDGHLYGAAWLASPL